MRPTASIPILLIAFTLTACNVPAQPAQTTTQAPRRTPPPIPATVSAERRTPIVIVANNVLPSVVNIQTESVIRQRQVDPFFGFFFGDRAYKSQSVGSGFVWSSDGIIVTNAHVIEGASTIIVNFSDGTQQPATVIGADPDSDLAVLRVRMKNLPAAPLGTSSDLLIGETVIAVGNPFGLSGTVTTGVLSATGRSVPSKEHGRTFTDFLQTDASINPGNSGGPLLNIEGKVIGINTAIYAAAQGIGFAIPVDRAHKIVDDLLKYGAVRSAWLGVGTATLTPEEAQRLGFSVSRGAIVTRVFGESPAERAGVRPGDVITAVDGTPVDSREAFSTFTSTAAAGKALRLSIRRGDQQLTIPITPINPPADLGARLLEAISGIAATEARGSVVVQDVLRGSRAEAMGLAPGDLIVGVNGTEVRDLEQLNEELIRGADRSSIVLSIARGRYVYTLTFPTGI